MNPKAPINHQAEFHDAWTDPSNTRIELPPLNINQVLEDHYESSQPVRFTRAMVWDMEVRKARRPDLFIPSVIQEGSASSWGSSLLPDGSETFTRTSRQKLWLNPDKHGVVLEQVHLDHALQKVTFIGVRKAVGDRGELLSSTSDQRLFHVTHGVSGNETQPLNTWQIVHLTQQPEDPLRERFEEMANDPWLPEYVEVYVRSVMGIPLDRKPISHD